MNPPFAAIWAEDLHGVIGARGDMLWRVPADFRFFRASTLGGVLIMGRVTFESLNGALDGRETVVISRRPAYAAPGAHTAASLTEAFAHAQKLAPATATGQIWVAGGGSIYTAALPWISECVVTTIDLDAAARHPERTTEFVTAPHLSPAQWAIREEDPEWREHSGDARWRVTRYVRVAPAASAAAALG